MQHHVTSTNEFIQDISAILEACHYGDLVSEETFGSLRYQPYVVWGSHI
jgi:hypothetical protein